MSRRTIIRPAVNDTIEAARKAQRRQKLQAALEQERRALARWQSRLRRAFNACEKYQCRVARIENSLPQWRNEP